MQAVYVDRRLLVADLLRGARCEMVHDDGTRCPRPATDPHEVWSRGRGGSILDRDNVLPLCRTCHDHVTTHPAWAEQTGYLCPSWSGRSGIAEAARVRAARARGERITPDYRKDSDV